MIYRNFPRWGGGIYLSRYSEALTFWYLWNSGGIWQGIELALYSRIQLMCKYNTMKVYNEAEVKFHAFLTPASGGGE
jgi:hypothetical protein